MKYLYPPVIAGVIDSLPVAQFVFARLDVLSVKLF